MCIYIHTYIYIYIYTYIYASIHTSANHAMSISSASTRFSLNPKKRRMGLFV